MYVSCYSRPNGASHFGDNSFSDQRPRCLTVWQFSILRHQLTKCPLRYSICLITIHLHWTGGRGAHNLSPQVSKLSQCALCCTTCNEIPSNSWSSGHWSVKPDTRRESMMYDTVEAEAMAPPPRTDLVCTLVRLLHLQPNLQQNTKLKLKTNIPTYKYWHRPTWTKSITMRNDSAAYYRHQCALGNVLR